MKTLIAYYSFTGNNAVLAAALKDRLGAELYEITEPRPRKDISILLDILFGRKAKIDPPPVTATKYDRVILVGPVWNAKVASPVASFLTWMKGKIASYGYVTICGGRDGQQEKMERQLSRIAGKPPLFVRQLALRDWLPEDRKANAKKGTSFKIAATDIESFRPAIDELVGELSQKTVKPIL